MRGTIVTVSPDSVVVQSREGRAVTVKIGEKVNYLVVVKAAREDIKPGAYLGIAAEPQKEGPQKALEVVVFPEAARGSGEGHRAWDLTPESTMTNATLADSVQALDGQVVTMKYKDGETKIVIPKDVPIVTTKPGMRDDLKPGVAVVVFGQTAEAGAVTAGAIAVGKDGVNPPM